MRVELVYFTGCPNVAKMRQMLRRCLAQVGAGGEIVEVNTDDPSVPAGYRRFGSPTVLVDGVDVIGDRAGAGASCRLQLPAEQELVAALGERLEK